MNMKYETGMTIHIGRTLFELEAIRPVRSNHPSLAGKSVFSLRNIKNGARHRITAAALDQTSAQSLTDIAPKPRRRRRKAAA